MKSTCKRETPSARRRSTLIFTCLTAAIGSTIGCSSIQHGNRAAANHPTPAIPPAANTVVHVTVPNPPPFTDEEALQFAAKLPSLEYPTNEIASCNDLGIDLARLCPTGILVFKSRDGATAATSNFDPRYASATRPKYTGPHNGVPLVPEGNDAVQLSPHYWIIYHYDGWGDGITKIHIENPAPATQPANATSISTPEFHL